MTKIGLWPGGRRRPNPFVWIYRWRYELGLVAVLVVVVVLGRRHGWEVPLAVVAVLSALLTVWPAARRVAMDRVRSVVIQHRLRSAFAELLLVTWAGRTPAILWTAHRRDVLRVRLLLPAGITASHFTPEALEALATACDVPEIRFEPIPRHTAVVVLVVVLRVAAAGSSSEPHT
jgi:hypothetical protein